MRSLTGQVVDVTWNEEFARRIGVFVVPSFDIRADAIIVTRSVSEEEA